MTVSKSSFAQNPANKRSAALCRGLLFRFVLRTSGERVFGSVLLASEKSITLPMRLRRTLLCLFVVALSEGVLKTIPNPRCRDTETQNPPKRLKKDLSAARQ